NPESIAFCHAAGMDYVSCSPFRVPVARLTAARLAIQARRESAGIDDSAAEVWQPRVEIGRIPPNQGESPRRSSPKPAQSRAPGPLAQPCVSRPGGQLASKGQRIRALPTAPFCTAVISAPRGDLPKDRQC